jgi:hypothetical protein
MYLWSCDWASASSLHRCNIYIYIYIYTYIRTYILHYIHTYIHMYIRMCVCFCGWVGARGASVLSLLRCICVFMGVWVWVWVWMGMCVFQTEKEYRGLLSLFLVRLLIYFFSTGIWHVRPASCQKFAWSNSEEARWREDMNALLKTVYEFVSVFTYLILHLLLSVVSCMVCVCVCVCVCVWIWAVCMCTHRQVDGKWNRQIDGPQVSHHKIIPQLAAQLSGRGPVKSLGARRFPPLAGRFSFVWSQ